MSTLDRAFIKAFGDAPLPSNCPLEPAPPARNKSALPRAGAALPAGPAVVLDPAATLPLSNFAAAAKIHDASRPMLEVDRLNWPVAVNDFVARTGRPGETFADRVVDRAAQGTKCVALAGTHRGDGRTTLCLAVARQAATRGLRAVVVDADAENPALARLCGVSAQMGWNDLAASELALGEALILAVEDGVTLLPWRGPSTGLAEIARARRTGAIFGELREQYDLVLVDAGPIAGRTTIADFASFAACARIDDVYLVHNVRTTTRDDLAAACAKLRRAGIAVAGIIENFTSGEESAVPVRPAVAGRRLAVRS